MGFYIQITCIVYGSNVYSDSIQLQKSLPDGVDTIMFNDEIIDHKI